MKKNDSPVIKRIMRVSCFFVLSLVLMGSIGSEITAKKKTKNPKVFLKGTTPSRIYEGDKIKISYSVKKCKKKDVVWRTSNRKVAKVSSRGVIHAKKKGKTKITAWVKKKKTKTSFTLRVKKVISMKSLCMKDASCYVGESMQINPIMLPSDTTKYNFVFASKKKSVATITENGWLTAHKQGEATITLKDKVSKMRCEMTVTVSKVPVSGVSFATDNVKTMEYGEKKSLIANVLPSNATDKRIKWKSSNESIAQVDENGMVTALRPSENVDITATSKDDKRKFATWHISITADKGYITKEILDDLKLQEIDKLMIVSHPDDELFWGGAHLLRDDYLVICVTNDYPTDERKKEFLATMKDTGEKCLVLDYPDSRINKGVLKNDIDMLTTSKKGLMKDIQTLLTYKKWSEVVTHNPEGEYGKYNHQRVSEFVTECFQNTNKTLEGLFYFGKFYWGEVPGEQLDEDILKRKIELINSYSPTAKGAIDSFGHMLPYENWIAASQWQEATGRD